MLGDGHEMTMEVVKYINNSLSEFLIHLLENYKDDSTSIIIISDHGAHLPSLVDAFFYEHKWMETFMGSLFLILSDNNILNNYDNIYYNRQKFLTPFDIHDTLLDMINVNKYQYPQMDNEKGQSLFNKINGKERYCEKYGKNLKTFCYCKNYID